MIKQKPIHKKAYTGKNKTTPKDKSKKRNCRYFIFQRTQLELFIKAQPDNQIVITAKKGNLRKNADSNIRNNKQIRKLRNPARTKKATLTS